MGNTKEIEIEGIVFKREDLNPSGSVKDRGISRQFNWAKKENLKDLVISSSGNAAISSCWLAKRLDLNLYIFVSPRINKKKLEIIQNYLFRIYVSKRPLSDSIKFAKKNNFYHLRSSADPRGTIGYQEIGREILGNQVNRENQGQIDSIFIPVSSGTTLAGVAEGFEKMNFLPQIHAVQTTAVNVIAGVFDRDFTPNKTSLADALVARYTSRKKQVVDLIKKSGGWGWVVGDEQIVEADKWLQKERILTSFEGAAALAAVWKAREKGWELGNRIVCLLTGRRY